MQGSETGEWKNLKFSAVLGAISAKSSILIRPAGMVPIVTSKKTIGFLGFGGLKCHSTLPPPPPDAIAALNFSRCFAFSASLSLSDWVCFLMKGFVGVRVPSWLVR